MTLAVPADYPPGRSADIVNEAITVADNANEVRDDAVIVIDSAISIAVGASKSWRPAEQAFAPGASSSIQLGATNTSNVPVDSLVIQEPKDAVDGATSLAASNPFTITTFTGFGASALPEDCASVQTDVYVEQPDGTWAWVQGVPQEPAALVLPDGVTAEQVGGVRVTCVGDIAVGAALQFDLQLEQRADLEFGDYRVDNTATAIATAAGQDPASADATATHVITPSQPTVEAFKNIDPSRIAAGQSAAAKIGATNGAVPAASLTLADEDFFGAGVSFGGFEPVAFPPGATAGQVTYTLASGETETVSFDSGTVPAAPSAAISGFTFTFTGLIEPNATVNVDFTIATSEAATGSDDSVTLTNTVVADVVDPNEQSARDSDDDDLTIVAPRISTTLDKTVRPSAAVEPGESTIVSLNGRVVAATDTSLIHDIVIADVWQGDENGFWNAFNMTSLAPTQVPANSTLTVELLDDDGVWFTILVAQAFGSTQVASISEADFASTLRALGRDADDIVGARFSFHSDAGFAQDTTVTPNLVFDARDELRSGEGATTPTTNTPTTYRNSATIDADGESTGGKSLTDRDGDTGTGTIVTTPGGPGPLDIEKTWLRDAVNAQSSDRASTRLDWSVSEGLATVTISDAADGYATPATTVFDAFDLVSVPSIAASGTPFTNGWYLKYDSIVAVELWSAAAGDWVTVPAPHAGWVQNGAFVGYLLTDAERADTQGVRVVLAENTAARQAARLVGDAFDPFAPNPHSGVGASSVDRSFVLDWQLRDRARSDGRWVTATSLYNTDDEGLVSNSTSIDGVPLNGGDVIRDTDADTILIIDQPPLVAVQKSVTPTSEMFVPPVGSPVEAYPTATWSVTAHNASSARASFVRVTDPATCPATEQADCLVTDPNADPFPEDFGLNSPPGTVNPFERFTIEGLGIGASIPAQVSFADSVVWLLRYADGVTSSERMSAQQAVALTAADLADVIGVSVTFQPANAGADGAGGTISQDNLLSVTYETRLRADIRSTGAEQSLRAGQTLDVVNRAFAQSYDPVLSPGVPTGDIDDSSVVLTGGLINITPSKTVSPGEIVDANPDVPVTVTLGATQGSNPRSTLSPSAVVIEDQADSTEFWNAFDFTGLGTVVFPAGANQVAVDVYGPFGDAGALVWVDGAPSASAEVPVAPEQYGDVQGLRFTFTNGDDGAFFSPVVPAPNWSTTAAFTVQLRDAYRDSGDAVVFDGSFENTQTSQSTRVDGNASEEKSAVAPIVLSDGTQELSINKLTNGGDRQASVGDVVPFRVTIANTGTGYLTLEPLVDALPAELVWLGDTAPVYATSEGGTLSTDVVLTPSADGRTLTFAWPDGGRTMQPGEVFTIDLGFELQPGLRSGESATNTVTAETVETLERCSNTNAPAQGTTGAWADDATTCGTTDDVTPVSGPNLFTIKGVKGSIDGAFVPNRPEATCSPTLTAPGSPYFRTPCVANSVVGGEDDWVLRAANAGTFTVSSMVIFDQLPTPGDQSLISGATRGSEYRPELVADSIAVSAPAGTSTVVEVTTSENVCRGTWANLVNQNPCEQAGETWATADDSTDWSAVTGIRVSLDFAALPGGGLLGGQIVDVTYSTLNAPATLSNPAGASVTAPVTDTLAINQFGVKYTDQAATKKIAPATVGVHLLTGSIEVVKDVTGDASIYAPDAFTADVSCVIGDTVVDMGDASTVTLTAEDGFAQRIEGIPFGAASSTRCTVTETGETGSFGESSRSVSPTGGVVVIDVPTDTEAEPTAVPEAQIVTLTNDYRFTGLSVTKLVDTSATEGEFGPFDFSLSCVTSTGLPVTFDGAGEIVFTLADGETFTAPEGTIPVGAECTVTETDGFFADEVVIVGDNVVDKGDGSATVTPGDEPAEVTVTNGYGAGTLVVEKVVDGAGAEQYGTGSFTFSATCTYQGQILLDESFELVGGATRSFGVFPSGTECVVDETGDGGATATELSPEGGAVTIAAGDPVGAVTATAVNTFDVGSIEVVKVVEGDGAELYGAGPFTAEVSCTWQREGETLDVDLPLDGVVTLSGENDYRASIDGIIVGAECRVIETDAAGATSSSIDADVVTVPANDEGAAQAAVVTITNTFDVTSLDVTKVVQGNLDAAGAAGPFEVTLQCTWPVNGEDVAVDVPGGATRVLSKSGGFVASYESLPVGSECAITESSTGGADDTAITVLVDGLDRADVSGTSADVDLSGTTAPGQARVIVTNAFDADVVLPSTGVEMRVAAFLALTFLLLGGAFMIVTRRRRPSRA